MNLDCYLPEGTSLDIHPGTPRRDWMDETAGAFAYRCVPLNIANAQGWEIRCQATFEAEWNGGPRPEDVRITPMDSADCRAAGHFGHGIVTIRPGAIFRTAPGFNLWVGGPPNRFKDGIQPLTGIVETDWMPYTFTMNWKLTRPGHAVRFEVGEPYCFVFPIPRGLSEQFDPTLRDLSSDAELERQFWAATRQREFFTAVQELKGLKLEEHRFQGWYQRGMKPDGTPGATDHQRQVRLRPFAAPDRPPSESAEK